MTRRDYRDWLKPLCSMVSPKVPGSGHSGLSHAGAGILAACDCRTSRQRRESHWCAPPSGDRREDRHMALGARSGPPCCGPRPAPAGRGSSSCPPPDLERPGLPAPIRGLLAARAGRPSWAGHFRRCGRPPLSAVQEATRGPGQRARSTDRRRRPSSAPAPRLFCGGQGRDPPRAHGGPSRAAH
jgi:hypothetical protein